jgi:hypothetical protein
MTHQGMNLNPHFDEHALPIEGLAKPANPIIVDTQLLSCIFPGNYPKLPGIYPVSPILTRDGVKCNE